VKQRNEEEEEEERQGFGLSLLFDLGFGKGEKKRERECLGKGIDICLNFQKFLLGFVAFGFLGFWVFGGFLFLSL